MSSPRRRGRCRRRSRAPTRPRQRPPTARRHASPGRTRPGAPRSFAGSTGLGGGVGCRGLRRGRPACAPGRATGVVRWLSEPPWTPGACAAPSCALACAASPALVMTTVFTRRSVGRIRRSTSPSSSRSSTREVTQDASQRSLSAKPRIGVPTPGSIDNSSFSAGGPTPMASHAAWNRSWFSSPMNISATQAQASPAGSGRDRVATGAI